MRATGSGQEWRRPGMKDGDGIKFTSAIAQDNLNSYLIHHQKKKISEYQAKGLIGPIGGQTSK